LAPQLQSVIIGCLYLLAALDLLLRGGLGSFEVCLCLEEALVERTYHLVLLLEIFELFRLLLQVRYVSVHKLYLLVDLHLSASYLVQVLRVPDVFQLTLQTFHLLVQIFCNLVLVLQLAHLA
jgi:hypothetical protein